MSSWLFKAIESAVLTAILTPWIGRLARRWAMLDIPDPRKVHRKPTPRVGGIAIFIGIAVSMLPLVIENWNWKVCALVTAGVGVFAVGLLDDVFNLRAVTKLLGLVVGTILLRLGGIELTTLNFSSWFSINLGLASFPFMLLWIVGVTVAINFIDGLDGLAAGIAAVTSATIGIIAMASGQMPIALFCFAMLGSLIGFLIFNIHPARIFMGDCGSFFVGFAIAAASLACTPKVRTLGLALPMLVLGVPLLDAALTMIRRGILQRRSLFAAERGHVHHRLMDLGIEHRNAVICLHAITLLSASVAILVFFSRDRLLTLALSGGVAVLLLALAMSIGSLAPRQIISALRRNHRASRSSRRHRRNSQNLQIHFDRAETFDAWWKLVCDAADVLLFTQISLEVTNRSGTLRRLDWASPTRKGGSGLAFSVPVKHRRMGDPVRLRGEAETGSSAEDAGNRVACFVRLIDEHSLASLKDSTEPRAATTESKIDCTEPKAVQPAELGRGVRVAIVHDFLYVYGGAERVLEQLVALFPAADLFSLFDFLPPGGRDFIRNKPVNTSFIQKLPAARKHHRMYLPLMPMAVEQFDMSGYDLIISSSYVAAKGVITGPDQLHISYCHSPVRFAWDLQHEYFSGAKFGAVKSVLARLVLHYIRTWDARSSGHVDVFATNSNFVARRIAKCYRRRAEAIYPPVDIEAFELETEKEDFYLTASRLVPYKRIDLIVEAFAKMPDRRLIVVGDGPEFKKIKALATPNVRVLGHVPFERMKYYMQKARAFVFAAEEDFGIVAVEAQACGTPVIAFGYGGAVESVINGCTGIHFPEQTVESIMTAVESFEAGTWSSTLIRENAERFSGERFRDEIRSLVEREWKAFQAGQVELRQASLQASEDPRRRAEANHNAGRNGSADAEDFDPDEAGAVAH